MRNNKQVNVSRLSKEVAVNTRKATRTKALPKVDVVAGYQFSSRDINLLSKSQKTTLSNIGTGTVNKITGDLSGSISGSITDLVTQGVITPDQAQQLGTLLQQMGNGPISQYASAFGNALGKEVVDALQTKTQHVFGGAIMLRQPVYLGGAITAANRMADITESMADNDLDLKRQATLYTIDQTYWTVVSLKQKQKLAVSYRDLVKKLDDDVHRMIKEGVATRADGLKVDVKVNEAEMSLLQVNNGLALSKMLLCQLCGIPVDESFDVEDVEVETAEDRLTCNILSENDYSLRPELRVMENTVDMSKQTTNMLKAGNLPKIALAGGYTVTNPSVTNGFENKFVGLWNVGVVVSVPVWNWGDVAYKVRASKNATTIATLELNDAREKVDLQVSQSRYKMDEAYKRLTMANSNIRKAEENLRCANVGFKEGVMESTAVIEAQTAWLQAQSQRIDAEIDVKLSQVALRKALGTLHE